MRVQKVLISFAVMDFGAVGDAKTDNTHAFQSALDAANKTNGGTGKLELNYLFAYQLFWKKFSADTSGKFSFQRIFDCTRGSDSAGNIQVDM